MTTLRSLANNRASKAAGGLAYGHVTTHIESYEAPERRNSEERVSKQSTIWQCSYYDGELTGLILTRVRWHPAGQPLLATACGTLASKRKIVLTPRHQPPSKSTIFLRNRMLENILSR